MSQVEIDKAKRLFDFSMTSALNRIRNDSGINVNIKPNFFKYVVEDKKKCQFMGFETPMDYVYEEVKKIKQAKRSNNIPIFKLLNSPGANYNERQVIAIREILEAFDDYSKTIRVLNKDSSQKRNMIAQLNRVETSLSYSLRNIKINEDTLSAILRRTEKDLSHVKNLILNYILELNPEIFNSLLKKSRKNITRLKESDSGTIEIFGQKYTIYSV